MKCLNISKIKKEYLEGAKSILVPWSEVQRVKIKCDISKYLVSCSILRRMMKYGHIEVISTQCAICNSKRNFIIQHLAGQIRNQKMILLELPLNHSELLLSMIWIIQDKKHQKLWFISKNIKAASFSFRKKIQVEKIAWKSL